MPRTLSTYLFVKRKLTPAVIIDIARSGVGAVEIFCARAHFDYRSQEAVREIGSALRDHNISLHALHAPPERDFNTRHESAAPLSISDPERTRRLEAVDEIKRALDVAENLPFPYLVQHMGGSREPADERHFDAAFNSLEHLHLFAKQRGVTIALENTPGEVATPARLHHFIIQTRLTDLRLCLDLGHAHMADGIEASVETMRDFLVTTHVHDNRGEKDEHLPPFDGSVDWKAALAAMSQSSGVPLVLELKEQPAWADPTPVAISLEVARGAFEKIEQTLESLAEES
jgi:sugar phosphate isomerase/epimerase